MKSDNKKEEPLSIDEAIALIISSNANHKNILDSLSAEKLLCYTSDGLDPLTVLNPTSHSLAYLYFVTARSLESTKANALQLFELLSHFIKVFNVDQVRLAPTRFNLIGKALLHISNTLEKPLLVLQSFKTAIQRFSYTPNALTALHAPFISSCILAKAYSFPLDILNQDIEVIDTNNYDISIEGFLTYYYYGSIIYMGNKLFDRALDFLSIVISAPTQKAISAIQIAAFKKFILVSLISEGRLCPLPKYTAQGVEKLCKTQAVAYIGLVKAFEDINLDLFNEVANKSSIIFNKDKHMGLLKQCFQSLCIKKIKELSKVYTMIGLIDMSKKIGNITPESLEFLLIEMINQKKISAQISIIENIKMVHFIEVKIEEFNLDQDIFNVLSINDRISKMNQLEGLNKDFQTKYLTLSANGGQLTSTYEEEFDFPLDEEENKFYS